MKKQKILIYVCLIIAIIIICVIIKINPISKIRLYGKSAKLEMDENILSYMLYDNTEEKLKALVTISKQEGITSIEYTDTDGKKIEINGKRQAKNIYGY